MIAGLRWSRLSIGKRDTSNRRMRITLGWPLIDLHWYNLGVEIERVAEIVHRLLWSSRPDYDFPGILQPWSPLRAQIAIDEIEHERARAFHLP